MKYSDRPISKPADDLLGRAGFALQLAKAIDQLAVANEGFVIGLVGSWGSGKSSVVELVVRYYLHLEMERASQSPLLDDEAAVPRSVQQLEEMSATFEEVGDQLAVFKDETKNLTYWQRINRIQSFRECLKSEHKAEVADRYWRLWAEVTTRPRTIVVRFSPWLFTGRTELTAALISELGRALGDKLGPDVKRAFGALMARVAELAPFAGAAIELTGMAPVAKLFSSGGKWAEKVGTRLTSGPSLDEVRQTLRSALAELEGQRVLVVIDDLDRLTPSEAAQMVALVKSLGDLPNVIYLLSYDDQRLAELIHKKLKTDGRSFLEKIVQYVITLPPIAADDLLKILHADLDTLLQNLSEDEKYRLGMTWHFIFRHYIKTPSRLLKKALATGIVGVILSLRGTARCGSCEVETNGLDRFSATSISKLGLEKATRCGRSGQS